MSEAEQPVIKETRITSRVQNLTDTASFNAFVVLELTNGQEVSTQLTFRHGIEEDAFVSDFQKWYRILDKIAAEGNHVKFHNGSKVHTPAAPVTPEQPASGNGEKKEYPNEFAAGLLTVEYKGSGKERKAYFRVEKPEDKKFPKFPVTVWPEVLEEAGIVASEVDPIKGFDLIGWTAVYEKNEKGFPGKVIKLVKPGFMQD